MHNILEQVLYSFFYEKRVPTGSKMGHPGIVKMKLAVQRTMYWIGLNMEIENYVMRCEP